MTVIWAKSNKGDIIVGVLLKYSIAFPMLQRLLYKFFSLDPYKSCHFKNKDRTWVTPVGKLNLTTDLPPPNLLLFATDQLVLLPTHLSVCNKDTWHLHQLIQVLFCDLLYRLLISSLVPTDRFVNFHVNLWVLYPGPFSWTLSAFTLLMLLIKTNTLIKHTLYYYST